MPKPIRKTSPFFQADMPEPEREMAFRQKQALLRGEHVILKDPYVLASSCGLLDVKDADRIARPAAQDKLDKLIQARMDTVNNQEVS